MNPLRRGLHRLWRHQHWDIGVVRSPIDAFVDPTFVPAVDWMPSCPRGEFRADPFVYGDGADVVVLYEEYQYDQGIGRISAVEYADGQFGETFRDILPVDCHASYPFAVDYQGERLCVPETHRAAEVSVYRLSGKPPRLSKIATLLSGMPFVDSTVFQHDGMWWLACTRQDREPNRTLWLWYANDLFGRWKPHQANPVKRDPRSSRPAGTPFRLSGGLYRPAQDCSRAYGGGIVLNMIERLNPSEFSEVAVRRLAPFPGKRFEKGIHTLAGGGSLSAVDGLRYHFLPFEAARVAGGWLSRLSRGGRPMTSSPQHRGPERAGSEEKPHSIVDEAPA